MLLAIVLALSLPGARAGAEVAPAVLLADGSAVHLAGLAWPEDRPDVREAAGRAATAWADRGPFQAAVAQRDRYGRSFGQIEDGDGAWLQGILLERGLALARVEGESDARALRLLEAEAKARSARVGLWSGERPPVETVAQLEARRFAPGYRLVEGRVLAVAEQGGGVYLNFGEDWKSDVTFKLDRKVARVLERDGQKPADLAGRMIRVRGWVYDANGPMIDVISRHQMEILP
ncbi:thermonuclease family protein [Marinivivus vitaminiproducens]|uniref:thermonuclease family protein n=1 Tax=Marinivivus vitaminiproducens TaxID=3035935 RepID=UPI00279F25FF|nr:thermonuclease family protein [Geminicoccaceae bacterium SCSIO 64248]